MPGWNKPATNTLSVAAGGLLGYSLCTRYGLGLLKVISMPAHLVLDGMSAAALLLPVNKRQRNAQIAGFLAFGLMEVAAALFTKTRPGYSPQIETLATGAEVVTPLQEDTSPADR